MTKADARLITQPQQLEALAAQLRDAPRVAFDTEAASFHKFVDRVYLIQVSSDRDTAVVDPLALKDLAPLGEILADPSIEVIFHDADYDLRSLDRDYGFRARNLFDTRIAAQLLGEPGVGLSALLLKYFGVTLNKKYQRADWSQRPLTPEMIDYAASDTTHLPALRDRLHEELRLKDRLSWAQEEFARLELLRWNGNVADPDIHMRLKGARTLPRRGQMALRALHAWRENKARGLDRATFRVMQNETLVAVAQAMPADAEALRKLPGITSNALDRFGADLLEIVTRALTDPEEIPARRERTGRPRPDGEIEARLERLKVMRNERAKELELEPGVLAANGALETVAWDSVGRSMGDPDDRAELRKWQREALGEERIRAALQGPPPPPPAPAA